MSPLDTGSLSTSSKPALAYALIKSQIRYSIAIFHVYALIVASGHDVLVWMAQERYAEIMGDWELTGWRGLARGVTVQGKTPPD